MKYKALYKWIGILSLILFFGCSFQTAGTGHEGEAKIVGTLLDVHNNPVTNCTLTVARSEYVPNTNDLRAKSLLRPQKSVVGENGVFSFDIYEGEEYTISGIKGDEMLLLPDIKVTTGNVELGNVNLKKGVSVELNPWWESEKDSNYIAIMGTDWIYNVSNDKGANFIWPEDSLTIYHYDDQDQLDSMTVEIKEGQVIGDTAQWKVPLFSRDDTVMQYKSFTVYLNNYTFGDVYHVDWGRGPIDTIFEDTFSHVYDSAGAFKLTIVKIGEIDTLFLMDSIWKDTLDWDDTLSKDDSMHTNMDDSWYDEVIWIHAGEIDENDEWYKHNATSEIITVHESKRREPIERATELQ